MEKPGKLRIISCRIVCIPKEGDIICKRGSIFRGLVYYPDGTKIPLKNYNVNNN